MAPLVLSLLRLGKLWARSEDAELTKNKPPPLLQFTYVLRVVITKDAYASFEFIYNSGWWNTWSVEATKTVAKYESVGEPQRMRLHNHTSNAHCALPQCLSGTARDGNLALCEIRFRSGPFASAFRVTVIAKKLFHRGIGGTYGGALLSECGVDVVLIRIVSYL